MTPTFRQAMEDGYALDEPAIHLGAPMAAGEALTGVRVQVGLSMLNRHGLVAGATGTGKTKTLQLMAGQLSRAGVPVFVADVKGDLTGMTLPADPADPRIAERAAQVGITFEPDAHPVDLLSLSGDLGAPVRATVSSFGPMLLARVLDLNATQTSVLALVFKYCDDQHLPLLDLADLRTTLKYLGTDEGKAVLEGYGGASASTTGVILRALTTLEEEGADRFFGEPAFEVEDLLRTTPEGEGVVHLLEIADVMDRPRLFSTFMLWMLAQLYHALPEAGDLPKPKLVFFFDEAHLLFRDAPKALLEQVELTVRLIRSKGVGVYFVTHSPTDVPSPVLAQLGNRVQHALRVFTPDDADDLRKAVRTFPMTEHFDVATDAHLARYRRGARDRALAARRSHAPGSHSPAAARFAHGTHAGRAAAAAHPLQPSVRHLRPGGRPGERPRDPGLTDRLGQSRCRYHCRGSAGCRRRADPGDRSRLAGKRSARRKQTSARRRPSRSAGIRRPPPPGGRRSGMPAVGSSCWRTLGGDVIRGVFGTLFGRSSRR